MAYPNLDPNPVGQQIADYVQSVKIPAPAQITTAELVALWQGIMNIIYTDLKANMGVAPGSFEVTTSPGGGTFPVVGIGGPAE